MGREISQRPAGVAEPVPQQRDVASMRVAEVPDEQERRRQHESDERDDEKWTDDEDGKDRQRRNDQEPEEHDRPHLEGAYRHGDGDACEPGVLLEPLGG